MRIQHNIMAMNAYRNYNNNTSALSKNLEKLSSGYKINRAGDDAAGLAISEKMRAQITGLKAASKNVKDGVSLVKTAEGALQEVHDMLNRMDSLATQSANGTYDNEVDRLNLQKEVDALRSAGDDAHQAGCQLIGRFCEDLRADDREHGGKRRENDDDEYFKLKRGKIRNKLFKAAFEVLGFFGGHHASAGPVRTRCVSFRFAHANSSFES